MSHRKLRERNQVHIEDLQKRYGKKLVLDDIDLSVRKGELVALVGPSGCGKSTLFRLLVGQELPTSGVLEINRKPVDFSDKMRGIVTQHYSLFPNRTALRNVTFGLELGCWPWQRLRIDFLEVDEPYHFFRAMPIQVRRVFRDRAMYFLEKVGMAEHAHKHPHQLSGGQRQRVAIAQSMIMHPEVLLMDEPFGALDPGTREDAQLFLLELWEELGMTVFIVTHDLEEALFLSTRVVALSQFWIDDRGPGVERGARIVSDRPNPLGAFAHSTEVKKEALFGEVLEEIRQSGFDPEHQQHVDDFNLRHSSSFQTLTSEETGNGVQEE